MVKKLFMGVLFLVPPLLADWVDDLSHFVKAGTFDQLKAENVIQSYIDSDTREIQRLEKKAEANDEDGFWATLRGGTYQLQWAAAKASLRYHKKVFTFMKGLHKNERDRDNLLEGLRTLLKLEGELLELKELYQKTKGMADSLKVAGRIAAKEVEIQGRKTFLKGSCTA